MKQLLIPALIAALGALSATSATAAETTYMVEPNHTYPSFRAPHMGISWWAGKFTRTSGSITMDREAGTGQIKIVIDAASVDFGHEKMNQHAKTADFFNVEKYPDITYTGKLVFEGDDPVAVEGELTMIGQTHPVQLSINSFDCIQHPMFKREVCGADVEGEFNRRDFGMNYGTGDEAGGVAQLTIQVEALKQ